MITTVQNYSDWLSKANQGITAKPLQEQEPFIKVNLDTRTIEMNSLMNTLGVLGDDEAETIWFECDRYFDTKDLLGTSIAIQAKNANPNPIDGDNEFLIVGIEKVGYISNGGNTEDKIRFAWKLTEPIMRYSGTVTFSIKFYDVDLATQQYTYSLNTRPAQFTVHNSLKINDADAMSRLPLSATKWEAFTKKVDILFQAIGGQDGQGQFDPDENGNVIISRSYNALTDRPIIVVNGKEVVFEGKKNSSDYGFSLPETYLDEAHIGDGFTDDTENLLVSKEALDTRFTTVEQKVTTMETKFPFDNVVTENSVKGITSGAVFKAINDKKIDVDDELSTTSANPVANSVITEEINKIKEEMGTLTFVPLVIEKFALNDPYQEVGTSRSTVTLLWKLSKVPNELYLNNVLLSDNEATSTQIDGLITSQVIGETIDYTLKAITPKDTVTETVQLLFTEAIKYGTADNTDSVTNSLIRGLESKKVQPTRKAELQVNADANKHIYIAIPASYGEPTFSVGGFEGGFVKMTTGSGVQYQRNGVSSPYHVYKSTNAGLGNTTIQVY